MPDVVVYLTPPMLSFTKVFGMLIDGGRATGAKSIEGGIYCLNMLGKGEEFREQGNTRGFDVGEFAIPELDVRERLSFSEAFFEL